MQSYHLDRVFARAKSRIRRWLSVRRGPSTDSNSFVTSPTSTLIDDNDSKFDDHTSSKPDPFFHITDQLLEQIFVTGSQMGVEGTASTAPFEVIVSHVSSRWRSVSINTPPIWSTIDTRDSPPLDLLNEYMRRSKGCPLDIRLDLSQTLWLANGPALLDLIVESADRWRRLSITSDFQAAGEIICGRFSGLLVPLLEHFSIIFLDVPKLPYFLSDRHFYPQIFKSGAPSLSVVRLQNIGMHLLRPPLASITTLHLEEFNHALMSYSRFCAMIEAMPNLTNLSIYGKFVAVWPRNLTESEIRMPALRSLRSCENESLGGLLLAISAPRLESLVLRNVGDHHLSKFLEQQQERRYMNKFPCMQSLTCDTYSFQSPMCTYLRDAFPSVWHFTSLRASNRNESSALDLLLGPPGCCRSPWKNLRTLSVDGSVDPDVLCSIVETRAAAGWPIVRLRTYGCKGGLPSTVLGRLRRQGVEVDECGTVSELVTRWPPGLDYDDDDDMFRPCR